MCTVIVKAGGKNIRCVLDTGSARKSDQEVRKDNQTQVAVRDRYSGKTALQCEGICAGMKTEDITVMMVLDIWFESAEKEAPA